MAVLPFINMSPEREQEFFCDGITEEILNSLTQVPGLNVLARTSAFQFKGVAIDILGSGNAPGCNPGLVLETMPANGLDLFAPGIRPAGPAESRAG